MAQGRNEKGQTETGQGTSKQELERGVDSNFGALPENLANEMRKIPPARNAEQKGGKGEF